MRHAACLAAVMLLLIFVALPSSLAGACYRSVTQADYAHCRVLSPSVSLAWNISTAGGHITFALDVDGVWDWISLGLSEGGMRGADITVCQSAGNGVFTVQDMWSEDFVTPVVDASQDVVLVSSMQGPNSTLAVFRRPLESCDSQDMAVAYDSQQIVIWAYGQTWGYHGPRNRGYFTLTLYPNTTAEAATAAAAVQLPDDMQTLTMIMPSIPIPSASTTYM